MRKIGLFSGLLLKNSNWVLVRISQCGFSEEVSTTISNKELKKCKRNPIRGKKREINKSWVVLFFRLKNDGKKPKTKPSRILSRNNKLNSIRYSEPLHLCTNLFSWTKRKEQTLSLVLGREEDKAFRRFSSICYLVCGWLITLQSSACGKEQFHGVVFPIIEEDPAVVIQEKLASLKESGKLERHQQEIKERIEKSLRNPQDVLNIRKAITYHSYLYDPSIIVPHDLKDHQGRIFQKAGTRVNPLDTRSLSKPLLFIDGDDVEQEDWALSVYRSNNATKIILIKGSPFDLSEKHNAPIFFDQAGKLSEKLKIEEVPTRVTQKGKHLLIESFPLSNEHKNHQ